MRLPYGSLQEIVSCFLRRTDFVIFGCLSFEERSGTVPKRLRLANCKGVELIEVKDPDDAFPNHSEQVLEKVKKNKRQLIRSKVKFKSLTSDLLVTEDGLLDILEGWRDFQKYQTVVLDITSLPKRYFCFFIKRILLSEQWRNVVVTYTLPGSSGYTDEHLAEDPMTCDHLPGFAAPLSPKGNTLVVSIGFESLSMRSILEIYSDKKKGTKMLLSFPSTAGSVRREWNTLRQIVPSEEREIIRNNIEVVAFWDAEQVYKTLIRWNQDSDGLTLAPFGPKSHSLGMVLFAIKNDAGLYYTQPKSYNPEYSKGEGETWAYVIKWNGIACFDRLNAQV